MGYSHKSTFWLAQLISFLSKLEVANLQHKHMIRLHPFDKAFFRMVHWYNKTFDSAIVMIISSFESFDELNWVKI